MKLLLTIVAVLVLWSLKQMLAPMFGILSDIPLILLPVVLYLYGLRFGAIGAALMAGAMVDLASPSHYPIFILTFLSAGFIYTTFLNPLLASGTFLALTISVGMWLGLWRLLNWFWLMLLWFVDLSFKPTYLVWYLWLVWLVAGLIVWLAFEGIRILLEHRGYKIISPYVKN